jgi:hypothetical protein
MRVALRSLGRAACVLRTGAAPAASRNLNDRVLRAERAEPPAARTAVVARPQRPTLPMHKCASGPCDSRAAARARGSGRGIVISGEGAKKDDARRARAPLRTPRPCRRPAPRCRARPHCGWPPPRLVQLVLAVNALAGRGPIAQRLDSRCLGAQKTAIAPKPENAPWRGRPREIHQTGAGGRCWQKTNPRLHPWFSLW